MFICCFFFGGEGAGREGICFGVVRYILLTEWAVWCVGTYQETNSHATRRGTLGHSRLSLLSHCGLILAYGVENSVRDLTPLKKSADGE